MTGSEPDFGWFGEIFRYVRNVLMGASEPIDGWFGTWRWVVRNVAMGSSEPINGWFGTYPNQVLKYPEYNSEIP